MKHTHLQKKDKLSKQHNYCIQANRDEKGFHKLCIFCTGVNKYYVDKLSKSSLLIDARNEENCTEGTKQQSIMVPLTKLETSKVSSNTD